MIGMDEEQAKFLALELMEAAEAAYLTTMDAEGYPQTRAMFNLRNGGQFPHLSEFFRAHGEDFLVLFSTNTSSEKVKQIGENPAASVYYCDVEERRGLMLGGNMEVVTDPGVKAELWEDWWERYYPEGVNDPDYAVLRMHPRIGRYYQNLSTCSFTPKGAE